MSLDRLAGILRRLRAARLPGALWVSSGLLLLALAFTAGVAVAARESSRQARVPTLPFAPSFGNLDKYPTHGAFGSITDVRDNSITVTNPRMRQPRTIGVNSSTVVQGGFRQRVRPQDLRVGDNVMVLGSASGGGEIQARFIGIVGQGPMNHERFNRP